MLSQGHPLQLLIVEDNPGDFILIREYLKDSVPDILVDHADMLTGAKEKLGVSNTYDAILLDLSLPDGSGESMVADMVRLAGATPVIILTGYHDETFGIKALSLGISDYLVKSGLNALQLYKSISYSIERKRISERLNESEAKHKNLFQFNPMPMWVYDPDTYRFLDVNEAAVKHYGYSREEFFSMTIMDIRPKTDSERVAAAVQQSKKQGGLYEGVFEHYKKNGSLIRVTVRSNTIDFDGKSARLVAITDVTDKMEAEAQIRESNTRYNLVAKATSDAIWDFDVASGKNYVSGSGYKHLFGYNIVNDYTADDFWETHLHPEEKERVTQEMAAAMQDENIDHTSVEYRLLKADGTYAYVRDRFFIMRENGRAVRMIGAKQDITHQKEEEHRFKLLESVIINAKDAVLITEADPLDSPGPKMLYVNEAFVQMTGYSKSEMIGQTPRMFQGEDTDRATLNLMRKALERHESCDVEVINYTKSGKPYWVEISIAPVTDASGRVSHFIAIEKDITSRKMQEQERETLIHELTQNNGDLRQFSYITSHNLRGPIASLLGLCILIEGYKIEDPTLKQILDGVKKATSMFDETIKDLTTVLNVRDRTSIPKENLNLLPIYEKALLQSEVFIKEFDAQISADFTAAPVINYNKAYMESIFSNLITNAIKYRSPLRNLKVRITTEVSDQYITMRFCDNGLGIDLEQNKEKMFRLYQRFHDHVEGKGLGLFLIKSQMEALNGSIDIESTLDKGTTFILKFRK